MSGNIEPWAIWDKITDEGLAMYMYQQEHIMRVAW